MEIIGNKDYKSESEIIFILAPQRSGTSIFLENIRKIPDVDIHNEPLGLRYYVSYVYRNLMHPCLLIEMIDGCTKEAREGKKLFFLKEPALCYLPIEKWFPNSKFIHIRRNKEDWVQSCINRPVYREEDQIIVTPYSDQNKPLRECLEREYDEVHKIPSEVDGLHITYEEMCQNPEQTSKRVCDYLGVKDYKLFKDCHTMRIGLFNIS